MSKTLVCQICHRGPKVGNNRPNSLHKTKRVIYPNIQKVNGVNICTRCLRNLSKQKTPK